MVRDQKLLAAMELKAQVGPSFGNNFNNRTEEAMGSALDLWTAYREGALNLKSPQPWLGYLFLLEDAHRSTIPVRNASPHFEVLSREFQNASYAKRYELFCRKLVLERKYTSACFLISKRPQAETTSSETVILAGREDDVIAHLPDMGEPYSAVYSEPSDDLNVEQFLISLLRAVVPM